MWLENHWLAYFTRESIIYIAYISSNYYKANKTITALWQTSLSLRHHFVILYWQMLPRLHYHYSTFIKLPDNV